MMRPGCLICWDDEAPNCARADHAAASSARQLAQRGVLEWSLIVLRDDPSWGHRHFLDGQPIHCGTAIELQHRDFRSDDFGDYSVLLDAGTVGRFEIDWLTEYSQSSLAQRAGGGSKVPMLHVDVGGHEFVREIEAWMRFRWPERGR